MNPEKLDDLLIYVRNQANPVQSYSQAILNCDSHSKFALYLHSYVDGSTHIKIQYLTGE